MREPKTNKRLLMGAVIIAALAAMVWSSFAPMTGGAPVASTGEIDLMALTEHMATQIREALPDHPVKVAGEGALVVAIDEEVEAQVFLDNLAAQCKSAPEQCDVFVADHLRALVDNVKRAATDTGPPQPEQIRAVLKSDAYLEEVSRRIAEVPEKVAENALLTRPFAGAGSGLQVVLVVDLPDSMRMMTANDLTDLELDRDQAFEQALKNLAAVDAAAPAIPAKLDLAAVARETGGEGTETGEGAPSMWILETDDSYGAARALLPSRWKPVADSLPGPLVAAFPNRDTILYAARTAAPGEPDLLVDSLKLLAAKLTENAPYALSDNLYAWAGEGWETLEPGRPEAD